MSNNDLQEKNEQILSDISQLQDIEKQMYNQLSQNTLSVEEKESLILKIGQISQMRINLYKTLSNINSYYESSLSNSSETLDQQTNALRIVEEQMNDAKRKLDYVNEQKLNKMRQVEINNYYSSWYDERIQLLKIIVILIVVMLILYILKNKNILPESVFSIIFIFSILAALYFIIPLILSMINRSNMNYSEYDWAFNERTAPKIAGDTGDKSKKKNNPWSNNANTVTGKMCVGQDCCSAGEIYDTDTNKCISAYNI